MPSWLWPSSMTNYPLKPLPNSTHWKLSSQYTGKPNMQGATVLPLEIAKPCPACPVLSGAACCLFFLFLMLLPQENASDIYLCFKTNGDHFKRQCVGKKKSKMGLPPRPHQSLQKRKKKFSIVLSWWATSGLLISVILGVQSSPPAFPSTIFPSAPSLWFCHSPYWRALTSVHSSNSAFPSYSTVFSSPQPCAGSLRISLKFNHELFPAFLI